MGMVRTTVPRAALLPCPELAHDFRLSHHPRPSTVATPAIFGDTGLALEHLSSPCARVPGTTGLRKRAFFRWPPAGPVAIAVRDALQHQDAGGLRHGFHDEDAPHHRKSGKWHREKRLVWVTFLMRRCAPHPFHDASTRRRGSGGAKWPNFVDYPKWAWKQLL